MWNRPGPAAEASGDAPRRTPTMEPEPSDGGVDAQATGRLRSEGLAARPAEVPTFTFGAARDAYRQQRPLALEDALADAISSQPPVLRQFLHHELKRLLTERMQAGQSVAPESLPALVGEVAERLSAGYPAPKHSVKQTRRRAGARATIR